MAHGKRSAAFVLVALALTLGACTSDFANQSDSKAANASDDSAKASETFDKARQVKRVVIRKANITVQAKTPNLAAGDATEIVEARGGYVDAQQANFSDSRDVTLKLKVPADEFDDALAAIERLGKVQSKRVETEDVTGTTVDLQARVKAQRAAVDRLESLAQQATNVADVLAVERELGTRLAELDVMQSQLDALDKQTHYATISVNFVTNAPEKKEETNLPTFMSGLRTGWHALGNTVKVVGAAVGFLLPYALPIALLSWAFLAVRRKRTSKRASKAPAESVVPTAETAQSAPPE